MSKKHSSPSRYLNRELSWLEFNHRVLEEARDPGVPLLERVKFLAITASNMDEFFMVRVGGLHLLIEEGRSRRDPSGLTPLQQDAEVSRRAHAMVEEQYRCFLRDLEPALKENGIERLPVSRLSESQRDYVERYFEQEVYPLLTPRSIDPDADEFPLLPGLTLHMILRLQAPADAGEPSTRIAVVAIPRSLARIVSLPDTGGYRYALVEDIVAAYAGRLFPGFSTIEHGMFRITRNADMSVTEDLAFDLLSQMEDVLVARRESDPVRLEVGENLSRNLLALLRQKLTLDRNHVYECPGPLDLSAYFGLAGMPGFDDLKDEAWPPQPPPAMPEGDSNSMFEIVGRQDVVLYHPYESFDPVVRFIEEAAADPDVLAIKQILYRTSKNSPIVAALKAAAFRGKQVTALVELKARFDEARNIEWARALEQSGVQVIYGIRGLKTHAKICLVVRRESGGIRRYVHYGTGNYNENTARLYTDVSFLTAQDDYGADASAFFNAITGYSQVQPYHRIAAAPLGLRARVLELIEGEIQRSRQDLPSRIVAKVNSLSDPRIIDALYEASQAGVKVDLNVRGICCLRPGVPGLSENIRVVSLVGRFLEHARIFYFHCGGEPQVFISSADWMQRNLDKRIELLVPVVSPPARDRLLHSLEVCLADNVKARELQPDGTYLRLEPGRNKPVCAQETLFAQARKAARASRETRKSTFVPHRPPAKG